jgi:nitroimidazol reductase NimA-like FMN-containing flavoprotein (pyridoxamine 5'-phosphate oxidase superfamily)
MVSRDDQEASMKLIDDRTGIEIITKDECLRLLGDEEVGRLGVVHGRSPLIFPVNFQLDGDTIVFRTAPGTKLEAGPRSPACFEIDSFDGATKCGWSVLVSGRLEEVNVYDVEGEIQAGVHPWARGTRDHWMRLRPTHITGRIVSGRDTSPASVRDSRGFEPLP